MFCPWRSSSGAAGQSGRVQTHGAQGRRLLQWVITSVQSIYKASVKSAKFKRHQKVQSWPSYSRLTLLPSGSGHRRSSQNLRAATHLNSQPSKVTFSMFGSDILFFSKSKYCYILSVVSWRSCVFHLIMTLKPLTDL